MCELHNDMLSKSSSGFQEAYEKNGKQIICDTALRPMLPQSMKM